MSSIPALLFLLSAGAIVYSYLLYPLLLLLFKKKREVEDIESTEYPSVSLVFSAYNEEKVLAAKLDNCLALDYPQEQLERIVVSDGSSDQTENIAASFESRGVQLRAFQKRRGKVNALNEVLPECRGEILVLSDANSIFEADALRKLVRNFKDPMVGCVCGELVLTPPPGTPGVATEGAYWRYEQFLKRIEGSRGSLLGANGGIYAMRKSLFQRLPANTIIDDFMWPMKILASGHQVVYDPEARAREETASEVRQERDRRIRIGAGNYQALGLLLPMLNPLRGFPAFAFFSHKVVRWLVPFCLVLCLVSNALLQGQSYRFLFGLQLVFYSLACLGALGDRYNWHTRITNIPYYFVAMNWGLLLGFFRFLKGTQKVTWQRTER